jgi:antitoxin component of RelBE/YafQ-DinJ toxin-antitoxin module
MDVYPKAIQGEVMSEQKDVRLSIRIPRELRDAALEKARREDLTLSQVVRHFLRQWLAENPPPEPEQEGE